MGRKISNEPTKSGYPLGVMIDVDGARFVDKGLDLRYFTHAKVGRATVLSSPSLKAMHSRYLIRALFLVLGRLISEYMPPLGLEVEPKV